MYKVYTPPECGYTVEGNHIVTDGTVAHKASGTAIAGILGVSPWTTPFQIACRLLGLGQEDISNKPAVKVGKALEDEIIRYANRTYASMGDFMLAEEVYKKREGDHDSWESDFDSEIFAGHVDGLVFDAEGNDYILEVKTSRNLEAWAEGVPEYYYWQVALYNEYISQKDVAYVLLGMVDGSTYKDPHSWVANNRTVAMFEMPIDRDQVKKRLAEVETWYRQYILHGITPEYDPTNPGDVELFQHLQALAGTVEDMGRTLEEYSKINRSIEETEASIKDLYDSRDAMKNLIKQYLDVHGLSSLKSPFSDAEGRLSVQPRTSLDEAAMERDGIDLTPYRVTKIVKTFSLKKTKRR